MILYLYLLKQTQTNIQLIMCYLTDIDPIGEEKQNTCINCDVPTSNGNYCSDDCKQEYND